MLDFCEKHLALDCCKEEQVQTRCWPEYGVSSAASACIQDAEPGRL